MTHHHHHVTLSARKSLTLSRYPFLLFIASGRSSGLDPISAQSCCMQVQAGHPAFARPCERVHRSTSLMCLSLLFQQCPACLVHLILIVFMMDGRWLYSYCFVGCCFQDLFNIPHSILVQLSSFFSIHLVCVHIVYPYSSIDITITQKKLRFILLVKSDFHMTDSLSITVHAFASHMLISASVDETLLPWQVNLLTSFRELMFSVEISPV